jgi:hypothetical protein
MARFHQFVEDTPFRTLNRHGQPVDLRGVEQAHREARTAAQRERASVKDGFKPRNRGR